MIFLRSLVALVLALGLLILAGGGQVPLDAGTYNVRAYGAVGDGVTDDTAAIQACIDAALGDTPPQRTTRAARGPIYLPSGTYRITRPLRIYSAQGVKFSGDGFSTRLYPMGTLDCVLDLNGVAYSTFSGFLIQGNNGQSEWLVDAIRYYWDRTTAYRSSTANTFREIAILNTRCVTGIRVGLAGNADQLDNTSYTDLQIAGNWTPGETKWWQAGLQLGTGLYGNILGHHGYNLTVSHWAEGTRVDATNFAQWGGAAGYNGVDFAANTLAYFTVNGLRSESSQRLFVSVGPSSHDALYDLANIVWSADRIAPDGEFIRMRANGALTAHNLQLTNGGDQSRIAANPPFSATVRIAGVVGPNTFDRFLATTAKTTVLSEGYFQANTQVGRVTAVEGLMTSAPLKWTGPGGGGILWNDGDLYSVSTRGTPTRLSRSPADR